MRTHSRGSFNRNISGNRYVTRTRSRVCALQACSGVMPRCGPQRARSHARRGATRGVVVVRCFVLASHTTSPPPDHPTTRPPDHPTTRTPHHRTTPHNRTTAPPHHPTTHNTHTAPPPHTARPHALTSGNGIPLSRAPKSKMAWRWTIAPCHFRLAQLAAATLAA